MLPSKLCA